ncbi:hypothetical protein GCU56_14755 [Geodermatophilus sabuli]|uniref:Uncharacterized protein n=1 Tax=Geodermatophilus sabuli TaxID=1564158 RepID=A0A7K3W4J8_9ACTN|nr:hypothetical protein [Geodermatophilus sabuli]NEK59124.1 hypothetical protein [Geodermatophilus sabuli]
MTQSDAGDTGDRDATPPTTEQVDVEIHRLRSAGEPADAGEPTATQIAGEYERGDTARPEMDPG